MGAGGGGRARMLAGGREKEDGGRGGVFWDESKCYDAAQRKRRCQNKTLSLLVTNIFRQFYRLKLDKH